MMELTSRPCSYFLSYRYMRPLVEAGHVYIALPPSMSKGKGKKEVVEYAWTDGELLSNFSSKFGRGAILQRY